MMENPAELVEKSRKELNELLKEAGFKEDVAEKYVELFHEHEIDVSIVKSPLLNHDLLKEIGILKLGHRLRILGVRLKFVQQNQKKEEEDYNQRPSEPLSIDVALGENSSTASTTTTSQGIHQTTPSTTNNNNTTVVQHPPSSMMMEIDSDVEEENGDHDESDSSEDSDDVDSNSKYGSSKLAHRMEVFMERAKYIPLRLNEKERRQLHLIEAALSVSDYTGKVDIISYEKKSKRSFEQLKEICAILSGLLVASDYTAGQKLIGDRNFKENAQFFQEVFEVGRRHKIMNPEKMRTEYGKLVYLLMDSALPEIEELMQFSCKKPLSTVYGLLQERGALNVLKEQLALIATQPIVDDKSKPCSEIQRQIKEKEAAVDYLADKYHSKTISKGEIKLCLRSIGDNGAFLIGARDPLDKMIELLVKNFSPDNVTDGYSLAISYGKGGARLSHDHERQYHYVYQSLLLWREITEDMFRLWILAEEDLLDPDNRYRLTNTGQGLNRVQSAPHIGDAMHRILMQAKRRVGEWVGSSVVHLGDHNVPNALMFIDKYTQVPRIINPVLLTVEQIDEMVKNDGLKNYIDTYFGGKEKLKKDILLDFFRHAFDGSGADNFFDAGSCIDGRLTSAWNWCEKLSKKPYFPIFKLSGFTGFDGDFQK